MLARLRDRPKRDVCSNLRALRKQRQPMCWQTHSNLMQFIEGAYRLISLMSLRNVQANVAKKYIYIFLKCMQVKNV